MHDLCPSFEASFVGRSNHRQYLNIGKSLGVSLSFFPFNSFLSYYVGNGLFAQRMFDEGDEVVQFKLPTFVPRKECGRKLSDRFDWWDQFASMKGLPGDHVIFVPKGLVYEFGEPHEVQWSSINHSSRPNVKAKWDGKQMIFCAICHISAGSEIKFRYNLEKKLPPGWVDD
jgi:hypothetical protein